MASITVSPLLRSAAELKIEEFERSKQDFRARYGVGAQRRSDIPPRQRVAALLDDIQKLDVFLTDDDDLSMIERYLEQAEDDASVSESRLLRFEEQLLERLDRQMNRYDATSLHMNLMMEAMNTAPSAESVAENLKDLRVDDDFEIVENELEEMLEKFESETFAAKDVDTDALEAYLEGLMELNGNTRALDRLREDMDYFGTTFLQYDLNIEEDELTWCILDLLKNDFISEEKKKILENYVQSPIALKELLGVLNMKTIRHWNYKDAEKGLLVTARQDADGQYHITVEEDLIDMLFLHCIAICWAQKLKECLTDFIQNPFPSELRRVSSEEFKILDFFTEQMPFEPPSKQCYTCMTGVSMPPPPPPLPSSWFEPQPKSKKKVKSPYMPLPPMMDIPLVPPPPPPLRYAPIVICDTVDEERNRTYVRDFFMSRLPSQDGCRPKVTPEEVVQANMAKVLVAEMKLRAALDGKASNSVSAFFGGLPHKTILTVLKFIGVPDVFVDFFARFLAAKLNIGPAARGAPDRVLSRARGLPARHGLELLFTEAVLFFADLAANRKTGLYLYRRGVNCYFVGTEEQCSAVNQELALFSDRTGLGVTFYYSQSPEHGITSGFLKLKVDSTIEAGSVDAYAHYHKTKLSVCTTIYEWVRYWNNTVGTYAAHLFGPLAEVFGKAHLEAVKASYKRIFDIIFDGGNLTDHVTKMLRSRPDCPKIDSPTALEPIIYLPQAYGGLGVKNPFIAFNVARNICSDPSAKISEYLAAEDAYYTAALKNWSAVKPSHIAKKLTTIFKNDSDAIIAHLGSHSTEYSFPPKEIFMKHREYCYFPSLPSTILRSPSPSPYFSPSIPTPPSPSLALLYRSLLSQPIDNISPSSRISDEVRRLAGRGGMKTWNKLSPEEKWVVQMYGEECFERFGTLEVWFGDDVPGFCRGVLWGQAWDGEGDDGGSERSSVV